jgi:hypothetical protein
VSAARSRRAPDWAKLPTEQLLDVRIRDLDVRLEGSWLEPLVHRLWREMDARGVPLRPHVWVSDEWASPDGVPGIQVPFYLLHPRLLRLERETMRWLEGGTRREAMRLLRHEAGHAVQHAWALQRRADFRALFGRSRPYPSRYRPDPRSRRFVQHLPGWYAQSHPSEDFAETFAVWLGTPRHAWLEHYAGWPALDKLEYVERLVAKLRTTPRVVTTRARPQALSTRKRTLREYYAAKQAHYGVAHDGPYDRDLVALFGAPELAPPGTMTAAAFVRRRRARLCEIVGRFTGRHALAVEEILAEIAMRCDQLGLRAAGDPVELERDLAVLVTTYTVLALHVRQWRAV